MLKRLNSVSKYINVLGADPQISYISSNMLSAGQVRYNSSSSNIEVYDGINWHVLSYHASVELTDEATLVLDWAREKMYEEQRLDELCKKYPGLAKARDNFEMFKSMIESQEYRNYPPGM